MTAESYKYQRCVFGHPIMPNRWTDTLGNTLLTNINSGNGLMLPGRKPLSDHCWPSSSTPYVGEWVIKFNSLLRDSGPQDPCNPYKLCNQSLYIGIIFFNSWQWQMEELTQYPSDQIRLEDTFGWVCLRNNRSSCMEIQLCHGLSRLPWRHACHRTLGGGDLGVSFVLKVMYLLENMHRTLSKLSKELSDVKQKERLQQSEGEQVDHNDNSF